MSQEQIRKVPALQATFATPQAALRARLRNLGRADLDVHRALALYIWAMMVLTGQDDGTAGSTMFEHYLRIDKDGLALVEDTRAVLRGLRGMTVMRALRGPPRRKRRNRLRVSRPVIRLNDCHYVTAWFVEQVRYRLATRYGWRRCPAQEFDKIIEHVVSCALERFGVHLSAMSIGVGLGPPVLPHLRMLPGGLP